MTKNTFSPKQSASVQGSAKTKVSQFNTFFTFVVMSFCNTHNTVSILQWIMLIRVWSLPAEYFVPARVLRAVQVSGRLVDRVADADATVRVHPREPVVLRQLGLSGGGEEHVVCREKGDNCTAYGYNVRWYIQKSTLQCITLASSFLVTMIGIHHMENTASCF